MAKRPKVNSVIATKIATGAQNHLLFQVNPDAGYSNWAIHQSI
jgi:hypothetical protein